MTHLQECKARLANLKANLANEEVQHPKSKYAADLRFTIEQVKATIKQLEFGASNPMVWVP